MSDRKQWRMAIYAARKIFRVGRPSEDAELQPWLDENPGTREVLDEYSDPDKLLRDVIGSRRVDVAAAWDRFVERNPSMGAVPRHQLFPRPPLIRRIAKSRRARRWLVAASLLIGLTTAALCIPAVRKILFNQTTHMTTTHPPQIDTLATSAAWLRPGDYRLSLTIPDERIINAATLPHKDTSIYNKIIVRREGPGTLVYKAFHPTGKKTSVFTLTTPRGGWYTIVLPDRTQITLNAATTLSFTSAFGKTDRTLILGGEARIKTQTLPPGQPPLLVKLVWEGVIIRVPRDSAIFNITAYEEDHDTRVTLQKGTLQAEDSVTRDRMNILEGRQYRIHGRDKPQLIAADADEVFAWTKGQFVFKQRTVQEIMRPIARWYNAVIDYDDPPAGTFYIAGQRTWLIGDILKGMRNTKGIDFRIDRNHIHVIRYARDPNAIK